MARTRPVKMSGMGLIPPLRLALAQINARVGDIEGNAAKIAEQIGAARDAGRRAGALPRAGTHRLSARGPAAQGALPPGRHRGGRRSRARGRGDRGAGRLPGAGRRRLQRPGRARARRAPGRVPQVGAAELRSVRRAALLPDRRGRRRAPDRRRAAGPDHLRGHLDPGPAGLRRGAGRRGADPQRVCVPVPRAQGPRAGADADPARARQPVRRRLLQHGRRAGRADLRRPLAAARPRGLRARARTAVRGGAVRRHDRPPGGADGAAA